MPQIYNSPQRIAQGNEAEAQMLMSGVTENVARIRASMQARAKVVSNIRKAMQLNPEMFGEEGFKVDRFGDTAIDLKKPRTKDDSVLMGGDTQTVNTKELINAKSQLNDILKGHEDQRNNISYLSNLVAGGGTQQPSPLLPSSGGGSMPASLNLNIPNGINKTPLPSMKAGQSASQSNSVQANKNLSLTDSGGSATGVLATDTTKTDNVNIIDPVKINDEDLRTMAMLGNVDMSGNVPIENNTWGQLLVTKQKFNDKLNEELDKYGTETKRDINNYTINDAGTSIGLGTGQSQSNSSSAGQSYSPNAGISDPNKKLRQLTITTAGTGDIKSFDLDEQGFLTNGIHGYGFVTDSQVQDGNDFLNKIEKAFDPNDGYTVTHTGGSSSSGPSEIKVMTPKGGKITMKYLPGYTNTVNGRLVTIPGKWITNTTGKVSGDEIQGVLSWAGVTVDK